MKTLLVLLTLVLVSSASAQCHLADPNRAKSIEEEAWKINQIGRGLTYTCSYKVRPLNGKTYIACEPAPGMCEQQFQKEIQPSSEPWCFLRQAAGKTESDVRAEITQKANGKLLAPYMCTVRPLSAKNSTPYYQCETQVGICKQSIAVAEAEPALTKGFESLSEAARASGEGYYREWPSGRSLWCDNAYGCRPR